MDLIEEYDESPERIARIEAKEAEALAAEKPWQDLGWLNYGLKNGELVEACRAAGHKTTDIDKGPANRGLDHEVRCQICRIVYHYDSSD
jgi:hypothetical protein